MKSPLPFQALPPEQQREIQRHLTAGETVLWAGRGTLLRQVQREGMAIFGSAFFALIALMIAYAGFLHGQWLGWVGLGIAVVSGAGLLHGGQRAAAAARSVYLVTNQRVSVLSPNGAARSLTLAEASRRTVKAGPNGAGDLYFTAWETNIESSEGSSRQRNGFLGIPNVREVDALMQQTFG